MAGNSNSGRHAKPISAKIAEGTYKPGKDGTIPIEDAGPLGPCPEEFDDVERAEWNWIAQQKHIGAAQRSLVILACRMWGMLQKVIPMAKESPVDKDIRCALTNYADKYRAAFISLGLTPYELGKLGVMTKKPQEQSVPTRKRA